MAREDRFIGEWDDIVIVYQTPGPRTHLTEEQAAAGRARVANGEDIDTVAADMAIDKIFEDSTNTEPKALRSGNFGHSGRPGQVGGSGSGEFLLDHKSALHHISIGSSATIAHEDLRKLLDRARKKGETADLTKLTLEGTPIFAGGMNLKREVMPQISKEAQPKFLESLKQQGISVKEESVSPKTLLPSQNEINAVRVGIKLKEFESGKKDLRPILISKDDKVLDGHHRWAVGVALQTEHPDVKIPAIRMGVTAKQALAVMHVHMAKHGLATKALAAANPVHDIADSFVPKLEVAVRYAFAKGRIAVNAGALQAATTEAEAEQAMSAAPDAVRAALLELLPPVLLEILSAGGDAALTRFPATARTAENGAETGLAGAIGSEPELSLAEGDRGVDTAELRTAKPAVRFESKNQAAIDWVKKHATELADDLSKTSRKNIKAALVRSFEGGGKRALVKDIMAAVGDKDRANMIAKTESMLAASNGQRLMWKQAIKANQLSDDMQKTWIATDGCCDICDELDGETVSFDDSYSDGSDGPPQHPNCRCSEGLVKGK